VEDKLIKTVLIVDDNDLLLEILCEVLAWEGFEVLQASNGRDALEIVSSRNIDLVISDVQMPNGDGIELMKKIHCLEGHQRPGLILVSGNIGALTFDPTDYNVLAVSQKPIDYDYLIRTIHNHPYQAFKHPVPPEFILTTG